MSQSKPARFAFLSLYLGGAVVVTLAALHADEKAAPPATHVVAVTPLSHAVEEMASAARSWWASLTPEEQAKAYFEFNDENRFDWHFIPRERKGLAYKDMTSAQRALAVAFLSSGLSTRGFMQAETIMSLDQILKEMEAGPPKTPYRDPENYSFTLFGKPGGTTPWGWRVEGHHLSLNFTIVDGKTVGGGPVFFGSNPAEVREGPRKGLRVLAYEDDAGFALMKLLTDDQKKKTNFEYTDPKNPNQHVPGEIITSHLRKPNPGPPVGLAFADMTEPQRKLATELVEFYAYRLRPELALDDLAKIDKAGWDKVHFAWAGSTTPGEPHYYRLHGPTFLVEFDDTQNKANHIHTVWRDAANDFGEDLLKEHYQAAAKDESHGHDAAK
jgi:hypothetical protein